MKLTVTAREVGSVKADVFAILLSRKELKNEAGKRLKSLGIDESVLGDFKAAAGDMVMTYRTVSGKGASRILLAGIGDGRKSEEYRKAAESVARKAVDMHLGVLALDCSAMTEWCSHLKRKPQFLSALLVEATLYGAYRFERLKTGKLDQEKKKEAEKPKTIEDLVLAGCGEQLDLIEKGAGMGMITGACQNMARDLVNLPGNHLSAEELAEAARQSGQRGGFDVTVFDKEKITELGMGGLLAVNKGSQQPPTFTILDYRPEGKTKKSVALVGKGVTFDSGGISLKPSEGMGEMKSDMSGAAAVLAAVEAAARLALPLRIIGIIPATDNMPGGSALKPGDVITTMSGITVEVGNTDAEGRLILADALAYARKEYDPDVIVDLATLTGACIVALGNSVAGMFSNDDELADTLFKAGQTSGEKVWRMPLWEEYDELIKSEVADVHNIGGRGAGAVTAAMFLSKFIDGHKHWAHVDIAGPAFPTKGGSKTPGATGFGVRLLLDLLQGWS
ncbi:MAG: leucyl aminopeptidase [Chlorobiaceae bacterium]|nr:leucyl aminopeptidase [Chlorobiaceae bacterium]